MKVVWQIYKDGKLVKETKNMILKQGLNNMLDALSSNIHIAGIGITYGEEITSPVSFEDTSFTGSNEYRETPEVDVDYTAHKVSFSITLGENEPVSEDTIIGEIALCTGTTVGEADLWTKKVINLSKKANETLTLKANLYLS